MHIEEVHVYSRTRMSIKAHPGKTKMGQGMRGEGEKEAAGRWGFGRDRFVFCSDLAFNVVALGGRECERERGREGERGRERGESESKRERARARESEGERGRERERKGERERASEREFLLIDYGGGRMGPRGGAH